MTSVKNRIVGEALVDPATLKKHPDNWRTHGSDQREAMHDILDEIGWVQRVVVNKRTMHILDGHLRVEDAIERKEKVPVLYVDVPENQEHLVLASFDPVAGMAGMDEKALARVLANVDPQGVGLQRLIASLEEDLGVEADGGGPAADETLLDQAVQLEPGKEYVMVVCDNEEQFTQLREKLGLRMVRRGGYKAGSQFDQSGVERVVPFVRFMGALKGTPRIEDVAARVAAERRRDAIEKLGEPVGFAKQTQSEKLDHPARGKGGRGGGRVHPKKAK